MGGVTLNSRSQLMHAFGNVTGTAIPVLTAANFLLQAPNPGQRCGIYRLITTVLAATTLTIQDTTPTALSQAIQLAANGSIVLDMPDNGDFWWQGAIGQGIQFTLGTSTTCGFDVWWYPTV
jgi:hypothetical protein